MPSVIRITNTMALTRTQPLIIGKPLPIKHSLPKEKPKQKTGYVHTVLIDTTYIPFDIVITEGSSPYFIITKPEDAVIFLQKITQHNPMSITDFAKIMSLDVTKQKEPFYAGNKQLHIRELLLTSSRYGLPLLPITILSLIMLPTPCTTPICIINNGY